MAVISSKDANGREVIIAVHPMRGAILTITRKDKAGRQHSFSVPLTEHDCRVLAADFNEGGKPLGGAQ